MLYNCRLHYLGKGMGSYHVTAIIAGWGRVTLGCYFYCCAAEPPSHVPQSIGKRGAVRANADRIVYIYNYISESHPIEL